MNRNEYYIVVAWREGDASLQALNQNDFGIMRRNMIDDGFDNLQVEWYETGKLALPDRIVVFVYWEEPDTAPDYEQVRNWGIEIVSSQSS
jgi:hypothetical protein